MSQLLFADDKPQQADLSKKAQRLASEMKEHVKRESRE